MPIVDSFFLIKFSTRDGGSETKNNKASEEHLFLQKQELTKDCIHRGEQTLKMCLIHDGTV